MHSWLKDPGIFGGSADVDGLECFYLIFELTDVPIVDPTTGQYASAGRSGGDLRDNACPRGGSLPITEFEQFAVTTQVEGDTLTVKLGADGDELILVADGDELILVAARVGS